MRKLGRLQIELIKSLLSHGCWRDSDRERWYWDTRTGTRRILDSLVKRGIVRRTPADINGPATYRLCDEAAARELVRRSCSAALGSEG